MSQNLAYLVSCHSVANKKKGGKNPNFLFMEI